MKKFLYFVLASTVAVLVACGTDDQEQATIDYKESLSDEQLTKVSNSLSPSLKSELENVLTSLDKLKSVVEGTPGDLAKIQNTGQELEENWDKIEKQVEDKNPKAYNNIESSLYPLIDEIKKDSPNVVEIAKLIDGTTSKINQYKETLGS